MTNPGYPFEKETYDSLILLKKKGYRFYTQKLVDTHSYDKASEGKLIIPKTMGDYILFRKERGGIVECKSSRSRTSYNLVDFIPEHQILKALEIMADGDIWYKFHICNRGFRGKHITYTLDATVVYDLRCDVLERGKRSLKWHLFEPHSEHILKKLEGSVWNLEYLMHL